MQIAGKVSVKNLKTVIKLHDLTGFDGRCDAIYFTMEAGKMPPSDVKELEAFRRQALGLPDEAPVAGEYDLESWERYSRDECRCVGRPSGLQGSFD